MVQRFNRGLRNLAGARPSLLAVRVSLSSAASVLRAIPVDMHQAGPTKVVHVSMN